MIATVMSFVITLPTAVVMSLTFVLSVNQLIIVPIRLRLLE